MPDRISNASDLIALGMGTLGRHHTSHHKTDAAERVGNDWSGTLPSRPAYGRQVLFLDIAVLLVISH